MALTLSRNTVAATHLCRGARTMVVNEIYLIHYLVAAARTMYIA